MEEEEKDIKVSKKNHEHLMNLKWELRAGSIDAVISYLLSKAKK